jgi:hypothetical protein
MKGRKSEVRRERRREGERGRKRRLQGPAACVGDGGVALGAQKGGK